MKLAKYVGGGEAGINHTAQLMMATPKETLWRIEPHTEAKHVILGEYLKAWFPILGQTQDRVIYLDGFCGPGRYAEGEDGSPLIALKTAARYHQRFKGEVIFYFIDKLRPRIAHLDSLLEGFERLSKFTIHTECDEFEPVLSRILDELEGKGLHIAPTFAFIDPFGYSGLPMALIHRLLAHPKTEAFINFNANSVNRFVEHPQDVTRNDIIDLFGTDEVLKVIQDSVNRFQDLRALYQRQLGLAADFVRFFSMTDAKQRPIYDLFFAGNHSEGHYRMKEAMWKADPEHGVRFSDATDPLQRVMLKAEPGSLLLRRMLRQFDGQRGVAVDDVKEWVRDHTAFLNKHTRAALITGQEESITVHPALKSGGVRRKFPSYCTVDFTGVIQGRQTNLFS